MLAGHMIWIGGNLALFAIGTIKRPPGGPVMINQAYALGWQLVTADHFTPGPVVELLALLLVLASLRWLVIGFRVLFGAGPIEVRPIDDGSIVPQAELHRLNVSFREYLTLPRLYKVTTIPGDPEPDRLIEILRTPPSSGVLGFMAAAYAYALPRRAFIISATLRTRDHHQHRYGVSVQVRKLPGYAIELESQWSGSFERALQRAAYAVGAYILPSTRRCENVPWSEWRGRALPVSLFRDYQRAKKMVGERRFDEAMALYHRALLQDADNIGLRYDLGQLYERLKLYPDALYIYLRLVNEIFPARPPRRGGDPRRTARPQWWPERARDPFVIRYRYVVALGLGSAMAGELSAPDWPQLRPWLDPARPGEGGPGGEAETERENRPWRASELADIRRLLSRELDRLFPSLADKKAPDGTLLVKLRLDQAAATDGGQDPAANAQVERYLLECALKEAEALTEDFRAMRARAWWRQSEASSLSLTSILQTTVTLRYRLNRLDSRSPAAGAPRSQWPHALAGIERDLSACHYDPAVSRKWLEHYNTACIYALALMDDDQETEQHKNHAYAAVESLERALGCGEDDDFPRAKRYWLQAGDPDFAGLRKYDCFRAFEARVYGRPLPAADDVARYELYLYLRSVLVTGAQHLESQWRARSQDRTEPVPFAELEAWWQEEEQAWELAVRLGRFYRQWQTRRSAVETLRNWTESSGIEAHPVRYPDLVRAEYLSDVTDHEKIAEALTRTEQIFTFLGFSCGRLTPGAGPAGGDVLGMTRSWAAWARDCTRSGRSLPPQGDTITAVCLARASVWAALRHWADGPTDRHAAAFQQAIDQLSPPPPPNPPQPTAPPPQPPQPRRATQQQDGKQRPG